MIIGAAMVAPLLWGGVARARQNGIASQGCDGCHNSGQEPTVTLTATPDNPAVGQPVTVTISVSQTNGPAAGFYITTVPSVGAFRVIDTGTQLISGGVTHTMPRNGANGFTTFQVQWAGGQPTGVQFYAYAVSANRDGTPRGDGGSMAHLSITSGCTGASYYLDQDADGFGTTNPLFPVIKDCSKPPNYSTVSGDCADYDPAIYPGAPELCDGKDNDCNGKIDENVVTTIYCQDNDGDGHGVPGGATKSGCAPSAGFGDCGGDCRDNDPKIHPGAVEVCDGLDNNCDGRIDEGARATCGVGWCARYAIGCTTQCTPGPPIAETCNMFDDDCDGIVDNGTDLELCGPGRTCIAGKCIVGSGTGGSQGNPDSSISPDAGAGGSGRSHGGCQINPRGRFADLSEAALCMAVLVSVRRRIRKRKSAPS